MITRNHSILGCLLTFFLAPPFSSLFSLALVLEVTTHKNNMPSHLQLSIYLMRQTFFTQFVPVINSQHCPFFFFSNEDCLFLISFTKLTLLYMGFIQSKILLLHAQRWPMSLAMYSLRNWILNVLRDQWSDNI